MRILGEIDTLYLETLYLPSTLKRIGTNVFCASISNIICKSKNFKIENECLLSADNRTLIRYFGNQSIVNIPDGVIFIKGGAFSDMDIQKIIIPQSVKCIGDNPFAGIIDLKLISYSNKLKILDNVLYHCCPEKFYHSVSCLGPLPSGTLAVRSV